MPPIATFSPDEPSPGGAPSKAVKLTKFSKAFPASANGSNRWVVTSGFAILAILAIVATISSGVTEIRSGQIGVVVNNITGKIDVVKVPGLLIHLPLGLTDTYVLDSTLRTFNMAGGGIKPKGDLSLKIKSKDGSDVFIDATVTYSIEPDLGERIAREVGVEDDVIAEGLVAYTRSSLRDELGRLSIEEVIEADDRNKAVDDFMAVVQEKAKRFGITINTIAAQNPHFNPEYENLIGERKRADQDFTNQASAQERARANQAYEVAEANRVREVAVRQEEGKQERRIVEAKAAASQILKRAEAEAYRTKIEGERQKAVALAEAAAIKAEGLSKAQGIADLARAYHKGGLGLVREALAAKYKGTKLNGRPYTLTDTVDRVRVEQSSSKPASLAAKLEPAADSASAGSEGNRQ